MRTFKDMTISCFLGLGIASAAGVGIFGATLGMCAICLLGAG